MIFIMVCGGPASGKTTAFKSLEDYVARQGAYSSIDSSMRSSNIAVQLYRWANEKSNDVMVVDSYGANVWTRKELLDILNSSANRDNITKVAIFLDRSNGFMYEHNKDEGHVQISETQMRNLMRSLQQPIHQEGFDVIYRIRFNDYLKCDDLFKTIEKKTGVKLTPADVAPKGKPEVTAML